MMRILSIEEEALGSLHTKHAPRLGNSTGRELAVYRAAVDMMPAGLLGIVCASDLQGHATVANGDSSVLMGIRIPSLFHEFAENGILPPLDDMGAILAGDLFAHADRRGGYGDCRTVWEEWAKHFRWVVGVVGNHDLFGDGDPRIPDFHRNGFTNIHVLKTSTATIDGIKFGGISGCIGNERRPYRYSEADFLKNVRRVWQEQNDITIMHDGPQGHVDTQEGHRSVTDFLESSDQPGLIVRGHRYWERPLAILRNGTQVLNCESRIFVLTTRYRAAETARSPERAKPSTEFPSPNR